MAWTASHAMVPATIAVMDVVTSAQRPSVVAARVAAEFTERRQSNEAACAEDLRSTSAPDFVSARTPTSAGFALDYCRGVNPFALVNRVLMPVLQRVGQPARLQPHQQTFSDLGMEPAPGTRD